MNESKTPRTDEAQFGTGRVSVDFARQLETELNEANRKLETIAFHCDILSLCETVAKQSSAIESLKASRDEWRKVAELLEANLNHSDKCPAGVLLSIHDCVCGVDACRATFTALVEKEPSK